MTADRSWTASIYTPNENVNERGKPENELGHSTQLTDRPIDGKFIEFRDAKYQKPIHLITEIFVTQKGSNFLHKLYQTHLTQIQKKKSNP